MMARRQFQASRHVAGTSGSVPVLFYLRGSEPKNFSQVGNHVLRISLRCREGNPEAYRTRRNRVDLFEYAGRFCRTSAPKAPAC
jgi:hypothetical protein